MQVIWDEAALEFWFTYSCLEVGGVLDAIKSSLNSQIRKLTGFVMPLIRRFGLPLGEEGMLHIGHNAIQVEFLGTGQEEYQLPKQLHIYSKERDLMWYVFPILVPPKSRREARECLPTLVQSVAKAIQAMHSKLEMAHLDIWLENVCFTRTGKG